MTSRNPPEPPEPPTAAAPSAAEAAARAERKPRSTDGGPVRWLILYTRGLIMNQYLRRLTMFYAVIAAMLMAFVGDLFLGNWLEVHAHLSRFLVYWLICGWLTVLAALLAIYDLLLLRIQHRLLRRELRARILGREQELEREAEQHRDEP